MTAQEASLPFMQLCHEGRQHCALPNCSIEANFIKPIPKGDQDKADKKLRHESRAAVLLLITLLSNMTQISLFALQNSLTILARSLSDFLPI